MKTISATTALVEGDAALKFINIFNGSIWKSVGREWQWQQDFPQQVKLSEKIILQQEEKIASTVLRHLTKRNRRQYFRWI